MACDTGTNEAIRRLGLAYGLIAQRKYPTLVFFNTYYVQRPHQSKEKEWTSFITLQFIDHVGETKVQSFDGLNKITTFPTFLHKTSLSLHCNYGFCGQMPRGGGRGRPRKFLFP
jgi:hypothetical protein